MADKAEQLPELNDFPVEQRNPAVELLLGICRRQHNEIAQLREQIQTQAQQIQAQAEQIQLQAEQIGRLKDEIAVLKGEKGRPNIKPSGLNRDRDSGATGGESRRRGKPKAAKTGQLKIHHERVIEPVELPAGSVFKGYEDYVVQDLEIRVNNTRYRRARYRSPDGRQVMGQLPAEVRGSHFGPTLRCYILSQYYQQHVSQNLILRELREWGVRISAGELNNILIKGKEEFHIEKDAVLRAGLAVSSYINVDDTGARHQGRNGYCTQIGNELFTWFSSTGSKSRLNFLRLLQMGAEHYVVDEVAREYLQQQRFSPQRLKLFGPDRTFNGRVSWEQHLDELGLNERCRRIATEAALAAALLNQGTFSRLVIVSDDAGQFNVAGFLNALCWIHAERTINKIIPFTAGNREAHALVQDQIWQFYRDLKNFKVAPTTAKQAALDRRFDEIFSQKTSFQSLNLALQRLYHNKEQLLLVLRRPEIPLHNNLSENDLRDYVKKRKISATTRSDAGQQARDTMLSLKKTCQKLGLSFWRYLLDRVSQQNAIPPLANLVTAAAQGP